MMFGPYLFVVRGWLPLLAPSVREKEYCTARAKRKAYAIIGVYRNTLGNKLVTLDRVWRGFS
jgi:hypothetical protein